MTNSDENSMAYVAFNGLKTGNEAGSAITDTVFCGCHTVTHSVYPDKRWFLMWWMSGQLRALAVQGSVSGAYKIEYSYCGSGILYQYVVNCNNQGC